MVEKMKEEPIGNKSKLSRLLPKKRWKKIALIAFLAMIVLGSAFYGYMRVSINKDVASPVDILNAEGTKKALVVYQVGLSSGPKDASFDLADGLASRGWRVEVTTASPEAPKDLSNYSLFAIIFPVYGAKPGEAATRYVTNLGDLHQIPTIIINCRLSNAIESIMEEQVTSQNGTIYATLLAGATNLKEYGSQIATS
jgi:hypothetical protein